MHPRLAAMATLGREIAMPASVLVCLAALGSADIGNSGASVAERAAPPPTSDTALAIRPPVIAFTTADVGGVSRTVTEMVTEEPAKAPVEPESDPIVTAALTNSPEVLPAEVPPKPADETSMASLEPGDVDHAAGSPAASSPDVRDRCSTEDACIDRYLWALYQRTPKEDAIRIQEQRKVTVRRKGRMVTVTRTFTTVTDEDFSWKDPKAAEQSRHAHGGLRDRRHGSGFQAEAVSDAARRRRSRPVAWHHQRLPRRLSPIDRERTQGGQRQVLSWRQLPWRLRPRACGGYRQRQWRRRGRSGWLPAKSSGNGSMTTARSLGSAGLISIRDPPHVAPIDGKEYADHHPGMKPRQEKSAAKPHSVLASREHRGSAKRTRTAS